MSLLEVRDGICTWFGGAYDPESRSYRDPQVPGLGAVRRARAKVVPDTDYYLGAPSSGSVAGSHMWLHIEHGVESRAAFAGAFDGLKLLRSACTLYVYMTSTSPYLEDATDAFYALLEAIKDRIRQDRCMGSGGFENGGFVVGEGGAPWLTWRMVPPEPYKEVTTAWLEIQFEATYYEAG